MIFVHSELTEGLIDWKYGSGIEFLYGSGIEFLDATLLQVSPF